MKNMIAAVTELESIATNRAEMLTKAAAVLSETIRSMSQEGKSVTVNEIHNALSSFTETDKTTILVQVIANLAKGTITNTSSGKKPQKGSSLFNQSW